MLAPIVRAAVSRLVLGRFDTNPSSPTHVGSDATDVEFPCPLAVMPATSHTAVITQPDLLHAFVEPFLKGETPKGMFE